MRVALLGAISGFRLDPLAARVAAWRDETAPISADDLPRTAVARPDRWRPNVTAAAMAEREVARERLLAELAAARGGAAAFAAWDRQDRVDYWAVSVRLARAAWELHVQRPHASDPTFYVTQGPGAVWDALVRQPGAWTAARRTNGCCVACSRIPAIDGASTLKASFATRPRV